MSQIMDNGGRPVKGILLYTYSLAHNKKIPTVSILTHTVERYKTLNNAANINTNNTKLMYNLSLLFLYVYRDIPVIKGN